MSGAESSQSSNARTVATTDCSSSQADKPVDAGHAGSNGNKNNNKSKSKNQSSSHKTTPLDPLAAFEEALLAPRHVTALTAEPPLTDSSHLKAPNDERSLAASPTPSFRRAMASTAAWTPQLDRRQSWDDQEYRRTMMAQAAGVHCEACGSHHHDGHAACDAYEANRGFSERVWAGSRK